MRSVPWSRIAIRELDHRATDGIEVRLLWNEDTKDVLVSVAEREGLRFEFRVPPTDALDAFHHARHVLGVDLVRRIA